MRLCFRCHGINLHQLYPWIHQCDNNLDTKDQLASIYFPDVNLSDSIPNNSQFSMVAGDFLEVAFLMFSKMIVLFIKILCFNVTKMLPYDF